MGSYQNNLGASRLNCGSPCNNSQGHSKHSLNSTYGSSVESVGPEADDLEMREQENFEEDLKNFQKARRKLYFDVMGLQMTTLTNFNVYDEKGHLCPFDSGLIENDVPLLVSGYIKKVDDEDPSTKNGSPSFDMGPILEWWTPGYDGGSKLTIAFSTQYAEYFLVNPSPAYEPIFQKITQKLSIVKITIEFLLDCYMNNPNYEDLIQHINSTAKSNSAEDILLANSEFICDQVLAIDKESTADEVQLISLPCMRTLVKLAGVTFTQKRRVLRITSSKYKGHTRPRFTKATTTTFVRDFFEKIFPEQMENNNDKTDGKGSGVCEACQSPDCGRCVNCQDMLKFGGTGTLKQACKARKCPHVASAELSNDENNDTQLREIRKTYSTRIVHADITWLKKTDKKYKHFDSYKSVKIDNIEFNVGDYVTLKSTKFSEPLWVAKIIYMYDKLPQQFLFHALLFCRGADTILSGSADPRELFLVDNCDDLPLGSIFKKAQVKFVKPRVKWRVMCSETQLRPQLEDDGENFYFSKRFEANLSRFIDVRVKEVELDECISCRRKEKSENFNTPKYDSDNVVISWKGEEYRIGSGVMLDPDAYEFIRPAESYELKKEVDEHLYPEYYRKKSVTVKGSNTDTPRPFVIGLIEEIVAINKDIKLTTRLFCRPEETGKIFLTNNADLTLLFWTDKVITTTFSTVTGRCYIIYTNNVESPTQWCDNGPTRFYFEQMYDFTKKQMCDVPPIAERVGAIGKGGKSKSRIRKKFEIVPGWQELYPRLNTFDLFAGCGGLSKGLHQAGVSNTKWAIEMDPTAAQAFKQNFPRATVFSEDCNSILKEILEDEDFEGRGLPLKGDVEMLIGGPPCQGFSGMNRFSAGQYSHFKNSLIATYLSFCDYYRPTYFILENVRHFVQFKRGTVLKLTISCLVKMGYQVTWGVLQAGHYGVPQTRRRLILLAAAPGYTLPRYPEPQHVFNKRGSPLSFVIDNFKYSNGCQWTGSAPYRTICVRDAIVDLPDIENGCSKLEMPYESEAISHFQRKMRGPVEKQMVKDHICKEMSPMVEARISHIPTSPGSDWRDLPNIAVQLRDGTTSNVLIYSYKSKKQKPSDPPRGVCICVKGSACDLTDKQTNTLIPWCLPHTADRHNNWPGLYGRLEWEGFFGTTVTNPEPMGKQGHVLHPEQNRVVSVRECARSQGFPDSFVFNGTIMDKHRQVGNAVPPPMARALGREIAKAFYGN